MQIPVPQHRNVPHRDETCHIVIADTHDAASQLGLTEAAVIDATRDVNLGAPSSIRIEDRTYEVLPLLS